MRLSVVIPTLNEEEHLPACLESLIPQLELGDEVIVVDGGSIDRTVEIASSYGCRVYVLEGSSIGAARDYGVRMASGDIILSTDADVVFPEGYVVRLKGAFSDPSVVAVTGPVYDLKGRLGYTALGAGASLFGLGCNMAFRREAYLSTSGYPDASYAEDVALWRELSSLGRTVYDLKLSVYMDISSPYWNLPLKILSSGAMLLGGQYWGDLGKAIAGMGAGMLASQLASEMGLRLEVGGIHIHHSVLGFLMFLSTVVADALGKLPDEYRFLAYGLSLGVLGHHAITEPTD